MHKTLTLHLGLPKTASTVLQSRVFQFMPGYLGNQYPSEDAPVRPLLLALYKSSLHSPGRGSKPKLYKRISSDLAHIYETGPPHMLFSSEEFAQWPSTNYTSDSWPVMSGKYSTARRGPHPITSFVNKVVELAPPDLTIKTVLVLRNQTDFLGSLAAQVDRSDDQFIQRLISGNDAFLHYDQLVEDLIKVVGNTNHLTLIYEDGVEEYGSQLVRFADPNFDFAWTQNSTEEFVNRKRIGPSSWEKVPRSPLHDTSLFRFVDHMTSTHLARRARPLLRSVYRATCRFLPSQVEMVQVSPELRERLRTHLQPSNRRLSECLGRELSGCGY